MASSFETADSWYFGALTRQEATDILQAERESGVFLIRDSATCIGDYVLCVKEDNKVSHYIINRTQQNEEVKYRIGDQLFIDLPSLLAFYKLHYLDTAPLIRPATKKLDKVIAKFDFDGKDNDDLPFRKGDILTILTKDEEQWWTAMNSVGVSGSIPVPYVQKIDDGQQLMDLGSTSFASAFSNDISLKKYQTQQRKLPARARVKQMRVPNAYDQTALKLEIGDIIVVTKTNINGQWEGELNGKTGHFPFTHVEFLEEEG
ncbi:PREDICTED: adapter molecule Crk-like isoform X2 [Nicrophorus vespilloides]|uniref:Adapter molecule Crk-like isoform X2 n=1 Tax=Nicrophorus vespilloides TaxID=110193 RepID=A0ABM1MNJ3_NICVS|nr:PREDICTED: adapter molecule Crk-like isoform X2 [Nicrophorus vespilloides]